MNSLRVHAQDSLQSQSALPLFHISGNSIFRFLAVAVALWLCNSFSYGQDAPLRGWGKRSAPVSKSRKPVAAKVPKTSSNRSQLSAAVTDEIARALPPTLTVLKIPLNAQVTDDIAKALQKDSRFSRCKPNQNQNQNPLCAWTAEPWPFDGIRLNSSSGSIVGTPKKIWEEQVNVVATDNQTKDSYEASVLIQVVPTTLTVTTTVLPHYPAGEHIEEFLRADGGRGTPLWIRIVKDPTLPDGVTLDANGRLSGTPKTPDTYKFKATVTDSLPTYATAKKTLHLDISATPNPKAPSPSQPQVQIPSITLNVPVPDATAKAMLANNQSNPFRNCVGQDCAWRVKPWPFDGMGLNPSTGEIYGKPTSTGQANVTVTATDPTGKSYQAVASIEVVPAELTVTTTSLPQFSVNNPIEEFLQAGGGKGPYLWTRLEPPALPNGLTLDANGLLSGTPTAAKELDFTAAVTDTSPVYPTSTQDLELVITPPPDCGNDKYKNDAPNDYFNGWFPLSRQRDTDPNGHNSPSPSADNKKQLPTEGDVQCFYNAPGLVSPLGRVQYLYGFDGGANTLAADLVSVQMPAPVGVQVSFGSSVTGGGTGKPASTSNPSQTEPNVSAALQSVEAGGNFYVKALYPIAIYNKPHLSMSLYAAPKMGFSFNGFASQATLSQGTEQYFSVPVEAYGQYEGIGNLGGLYINYRGGFESVPGSFARSAGLSQHNFLLQQFAFGFDFGAFRIGAQRFIGPAAAFNAPGTSANSFNKWHLVIQMSPKGGG